MLTAEGLEYGPDSVGVRTPPRRSAEPLRPQPRCVRISASFFVSSVLFLTRRRGLLCALMSPFSCSPSLGQKVGEWTGAPFG